MEQKRSKTTSQWPAVRQIEISSSHFANAIIRALSPIPHFSTGLSNANGGCWVYPQRGDSQRFHHWAWRNVWGAFAWSSSGDNGPVKDHSWMVSSQPSPPVGHQQLFDQISKPLSLNLMVILICPLPQSTSSPFFFVAFFWLSLLLGFPLFSQHFSPSSANSF